MLRGGIIQKLPPQIVPGRHSAESIHFGFEHLTDYYFYWCTLLHEGKPGETMDKTSTPNLASPTHGHKRYHHNYDKQIGEFDPDDFGEMGESG